MYTRTDVKCELAITKGFCFCNSILSILSCWMLHDKFPTTAFVYIDGHPFSNHSAAAVLYLEYQVDRMYSVVKISSFPFYMYIIYNIHAVAILWERGYIAEICSFAIFKIHTLRIRIAEIAWKYSGSEFETTQLNFQNKRDVYNI